MFLSRAFGRTLFAAARSKHYSTTAAAAGGREVHNPLQEFFEADRSTENDKPVVYGMHYASLIFIWIWNKNSLIFIIATIVQYNNFFFYFLHWAL